MKKILALTFAVAMAAVCTNLFAEDAPAPVQKPALENSVSLRTSFADSGMFLNYAEFITSYGKWMIFDPGWLNFGNLRYGEGFIGGGRVWTIGKTVVVGELYYDRSYGDLSDHANYLQTFLGVSHQFGSGYSVDGTGFPYIPLDRKGTKQFVLDHVTFRKALNKKWQGGIGYAAYRFGNNPVQHKPLLSLTYSSKVGSLETILMHVPNSPGAVGVQFRYSANLPHRHLRK